MMVGFIATLLSVKSGGSHQFTDRQNRSCFVGPHKFMKIIGLDFIQNFPDIGSGFKFRKDLAISLPCGGYQTFDTFNTLDFLLDFNADPLFHLGRAGPRVRHGYIDHVQGELRRHDIPVIPVDTVENVTDQLREKLGGQRVLQ